MIVENKHTKVDWKQSSINHGYVHEVTIPWNNQTGKWWNESCADVIEVFGLPGDRFRSHPTMTFMAFYFKSEKDAALCRVLLSESI
jgi:hypothetical protein